jgi:hypothetical protein
MSQVNASTARTHGGLPRKPAPWTKPLSDELCGATCVGTGLGLAISMKLAEVSWRRASTCHLAVPDRLLLRFTVNGRENVGRVTSGRRLDLLLHRQGSGEPCKR